MNKKMRFGIYTLLIIIFQSILKFYGFIMTRSLSLLSETVDTIVDIIFISITLYSIKQSEKPPDYEHMYGHSKVDPIGALVQGIVLINLYILLIITAMQILLTGAYVMENPGIGLTILMISFTVNLIFSRILIWEGKRHKSPSLKIQGFNLFQDSMRAIIVLISFIFAIYGIIYLDPIFSILLSIWIIIGAFLLAKNGLKDLTDTNPVNKTILEEIEQHISNLEHVNGVNEIKVRASGKKLFLEAHLSVEDHISVIHAHDITKSIQAISKRLIQFYDVECVVEMNPLGGEASLGDTIINLIYSMKTEYPEIINIKDLNILRMKDNYFLTLIIVINDALTLEKAHDICTNFENDLKKQETSISRIITHIEAQKEEQLLLGEDIFCETIDEQSIKQIEKRVEEVLKSFPQIRGYHGFEFWTSLNSCILEMHIFFDGNLNISVVHHYLEELEYEIRKKLRIENLYDVILHSEPVEGRKNGKIFNN